MQAELSKILHRIPWFLELNQEQLDCLTGITTLHRLEPGDLLFKEGDREDFLYFLIEGQMVLEIEIPGHGQVVFYTAETMDIVGWSSMTPIARQRTATARATQRCMLVGLQNELLAQLCEEDHDIGYIIMRRLANVVANRLLTTRVYLMELIAHTTPQETGLA